MQVEPWELAVATSPDKKIGCAGYGMRGFQTQMAWGCRFETHLPRKTIQRRYVVSLGFPKNNHQKGGTLNKGHARGFSPLSPLFSEVSGCQPERLCMCQTVGLASRHSVRLSKVPFRYMSIGFQRGNSSFPADFLAGFSNRFRGPDRGFVFWAKDLPKRQAPCDKGGESFGS